MGAIISLGSTAACCFGSAACAVCSCCPSMCNSSITSRVMYSVMLLLTMVVCCIMLAPGLQDSLASVPFCKSHGNSLASFSEDLDSFGSKIGLGKVGAGMGIGSTSFQVIYKHGSSIGRYTKYCLVLSFGWSITKSHSLGRLFRGSGVHGCIQIVPHSNTFLHGDVHHNDQC